SELCKKYSEGLVDIWFRKLELAHLDDKYAFVLTDDEGFVDLLNNKYVDSISAAINEVMGYMPLTKVFARRNFTVEGAILSVESPVKPDNLYQTAEIKEKNDSAETNSHYGASVLMPDDEYTFENFVVGSSNKFAHAVSLAVANHPAEEYNPLFIYGSSGLGKTHLIKAIANKVRSEHPDYKIIFVKGDDFTTEMVDALANKTMSKFKDKYRGVDMLLVDDVQFIGGKVATQEEFFHTFNTLYENNKQIIITSDKPPKEIQHLEERIKSRFEGGMIADIQPPDTELRIAILKRKAETMNVNLSNEVLTFIGENVKNNIRQIEGVIKKLGAYSYINQAPITVETAKEQLKGFISQNSSPMETAEKIISNVSNIYGVSTDEIKGRSRSKEIAIARHVAVYVIKKVTSLSQDNIGKIFNRDHTTILASIDVIKSKMISDSDTERIVNNLIKDFSS
ncbi:MAG: chromosomal replication initiator protein DnaA, partial [Clostridiales bacterium]|nr:chromosomal replication initiator protein DnaA [Clostridiales bacterium]